MFPSKHLDTLPLEIFFFGCSEGLDAFGILCDVVDCLLRTSECLMLVYEIGVKQALHSYAYLFDAGAGVEQALHI